MRCDIMSEWLCAFYKHIGKQRRVLLLMDNFSAHLSALDSAPPPSNIKVLFFPANATSVYQPLVDVPSSTEAINSIQNAILWAQHQEDTTEQDIRHLEDIERLFTRLQMDGKKQRSLYDCWTS
jgi:hypothetical protein